MLVYNSEILKINPKFLFNTQEVYMPPLPLPLATSHHIPDDFTVLDSFWTYNPSKHLPSKQKVIICRF